MSEDDKVERAASSCQQLTEKILLGLSSKRSDEEWEHFKERTVEMFRQKGLFDRSNQQPDGKTDA